jgi:hypothetical protein
VKEEYNKQKKIQTRMRNLQENIAVIFMTGRMKVILKNRGRLFRSLPKSRKISSQITQRKRRRSPRRRSRFQADKLLVLTMKIRVLLNSHMVLITV